MWPIAFALKELTAVEEAKIGALVKKRCAEDRVAAGRLLVPDRRSGRVFSHRDSAAFGTGSPTWSF
jgi:hypothetical protein